MSNPDTISSTNDTNTNSTSASFTGLYMGVAEAVILFIAIILIFKFADDTIRIKVLWILLPILAFIIATGLNFGAQYTTCGTTNGKNALKGAIASPIAVLFGLGVASVDYCRIPVASVFTPLFTESTTDIIKGNNNGTNKRLSSSKNNAKKGGAACCAPQTFLTDMEDKYPLLKMCSYVFYISFSVMFGSIIGTGVATVC